MRCLLLGVALVVACIGTAVAQSPPVTPAIAFEVNALTVSGLTHGGRVGWLLAARHFEDLGLRLLSRKGVVRDEDGNGEVRIELDQAVPEQSVAVVVDLDSGTTAVAAMAGFSLHAFELPQSAIHPGSANNGHVFELRGRRLIDLALFRTGQGQGSGAFHRTAGDGGVSDRDGERNGRVEVALDSLEPAPGVTQASPTIVRPDDIVVAIDSETLDVFGPRRVEPR